MTHRFPFPLLLLAGATACGQAADALYAENLLIQELDPAESPSRGGARVAIRGLAICDDLQVKFGGLPSPEVTVISRQFALAETPPHPIGEVTIELSCAREGTASAPFRFTAAEIELSTRLHFPPVDDRHFADLDGDGLDDLISLTGPVTLSVYHNAGYGGFAGTPFVELNLDGIGTADMERSWHTVELTGDGIADVFAIGRSAVPRVDQPEQLIIVGRLFRSENQFQPEEFELPASPDSFLLDLLEVTDFDDDGRFDLVLTEIGGRSSVPRFYVLQQEQERFFTRYDVSLRGTRFDWNDRTLKNGVVRPTRDFNGDGFGDLAIATSPDYADTSSTGEPLTGAFLSYLLGRAEGGPELREYYQPMSTETWHGGGRFIFYNDDVLPDLVVGPFEFPGRANPQIYLATGIGELQSPITLDPICDLDCPSLGRIHDLDLDLNGDGRREHLAETEDGMALLRHDLRLVPLAGGEAPFSVVRLIEGRPPALIYGASPPRTAILSRGGFDVRETPVLVDRVDQFCTGDLNGDGRGDLVTVDREGVVRLLETREGGGFAVPREIAPAIDEWADWVGHSDHENCVIIDADGDGRRDVYVRDPSMRVLFNRGATFEARLLEEMKGKIARVSWADLGHDGQDELIAIGFGTPSYISVLRWSSGQFELVMRSADDERELGSFAGDFDGDGVLDVISFSYSDPIGVELHRGSLNGTTLELTQAHTFDPTLFIQPEIFESGGSSAGRLEIRDLNGDQRPELVFNAHDGLALHIFWNDGQGNFAEPSTLEQSRALDYALACDLDADARVDLLYTGVNGLIAWSAQRGGQFLPAESIEVDAAKFQRHERPAPTACTDVDEDGLLDVLYHDEESRSVHIAVNRTH